MCLLPYITHHCWGTGRSKGALIFAVAVGLLIDGGAPLLIGIRKRLFRAAGLALLPVAALVIPHNILALVRIEILILDMSAGFTGTALDAPVFADRVLLGLPTAVGVLLALRAGLFRFAAANAEGIWRQ